jgi:hypothetical protein
MIFMSKVYNKLCIKPLGVELIQAKGTVYFSRYFTLSINFFHNFLPNIKTFSLNLICSCYKLLILLSFTFLLVFNKPFMT